MLHSPHQGSSEPEEAASNAHSAVQLPVLRQACVDAWHCRPTPVIHTSHWRITSLNPRHCWILDKQPEYEYPSKGCAWPGQCFNTNININIKREATKFPLLRSTAGVRNVDMSLSIARCSTLCRNLVRKSPRGLRNLQEAHLSEEVQQF